MGILKALGLSGRGTQARDTLRFDAPVRPDEPFVAIGDIHGQAKSLKTAFAALDETDPDTKIICLGDYVDRGEHSAEVLRFLMARTEDAPHRVFCLLGNHEHMLIKFLKDPERHAAFWLRNGGLQTLASFGVGFSHDSDMNRVRLDLARAMGADMIDWLGARPDYWISGNVAATHAGADPSKPIGAQPRECLLWGHRDFAKTPRADGTWVVHGHTIVDAPQIENGRVAIDTGAYATGRLTAARITTDSIAFLEFS